MYDMIMYTHILLHVDQNVSGSQMIKSYMTYGKHMCTVDENDDGMYVTISR